MISVALRVGAYRAVLPRCLGLTFSGMLMQPRKSSAFSSEPDDADPLARTDLAICLKYLMRRKKKNEKASTGVCTVVV